MNSVLLIEKRVRLGSAECRRLRKEGQTPGNIYGHGVDPLAVRVAEDALLDLVRKRARVIDVDCDGEVQKALLRDIQWDTFGNYIQHFDLIRVDPNEQIVVEVPLVVRGTSPGSQQGGVFEMPLRTIGVRCPTVVVPESLEVRISSLQLGDAIHASDLELPEGASLEVPDETVVCQVRAVIESEDEEGDVGPVEPELIGRDEKDAGDTD